ncbi:MAG: alanine--tRNA ligase [Candidatus Daviesbacteria bacterium]
MTSEELRKKYLEFFQKKGHKVIPSAPLVPENDPSVLFTTAGMHPLVPYLLGQPHPEGKKLVNVQKCLRTDDIDEVGDFCHHTFFEMLGNWSLGDYWKKEAITFTYEFFTQELELKPDRLLVTCFAGDQDATKDTKSAQVWESLGIPKEKIFFNGKKDNWWASPGETGPCGPDSEIFIDLTNKACGDNCKPGCNCGRFTEIGNNVFMEYNKTTEGKFEKLKQRNVDFGGGLERILAIINNLEDDYQTDLFLPIIEKIEKITGKKYADNLKEFRIIADHLKAATFLILDGVAPSNKLEGYVLRRLLRRSMIKMHTLSGKVWNGESVMEIIEIILKIYDGVYGINSEVDQNKVATVITDEMIRFAKTLDVGLKEINKIEAINGKVAFDLYQTYGFPLELTQELFIQKGQPINYQEFEEEFKKHQELSRTASAGMFKGGLTEQSEIATKYHTATHLLHAALRQILGSQVGQKGSNITSERLRFDFSYPEKLTEQQLKEVEDLVNQKIQENLKVNCEEMKKEDALSSGALGFFVEKYGEKVTVYTISENSHPERAKRVEGSPFSREICGGPHVKNTGSLGNFKIIKEESAGAGIRRIYATLS